MELLIFMDKHLCPYCETVHLTVRYISVNFFGKKHELPGLVCPQCGCELFLSQEIRNFLNSKSAKLAKNELFELR